MMFCNKGATVLTGTARSEMILNVCELAQPLVALMPLTVHVPTLLAENTAVGPLNTPVLPNQVKLFAAGVRLSVTLGSVQVILFGPFTLNTRGFGTALIVKVVDALQPLFVVTVAVYTPASIPPVAEVCVPDCTPFGRVDHETEYAGELDDGRKLKPRLNAFAGLVHWGCTIVGVSTGCGFTVTLAIPEFVTVAFR